MVAMTSALSPVSPNRRRRVRHKIQTPAYATFGAESQGAMLDLHEIIDISEDGIAIQYNSQLDRDRRVNLCLDLADCAEHIYTTGHVIWSNAGGRAGLQFSELSPHALARLREWLFVNVMAGVANSEVDLDAPFAVPDAPTRLNYTDSLAAVNAVQRQVESLGSDLSAALQLITERAQSLVRASGAAIALSDGDPDFMVCRASSGPDAPPVEARMRTTSGFSGECVSTGMQLRCDDTELDSRVDPEACRALGIRSMLAAPVRAGEKSIGILEAFSAQPNTFSEADGKVLQRLAETVVAAVNRAAQAEDLPPLQPAPVAQFAPSPGSVLFASPPAESTGDAQQAENHEGKSNFGISLPRTHLIVLYCIAGGIFLVLGFMSAPLIQSKLEERARSQTVLAASRPPAAELSPAATPPSSAVETATFAQLKLMAENGDPAAENALGLRYSQGDRTNGVRVDEQEAFRWFQRAAEHGNLNAQAKLGFLYWGGRGVAKDIKQAYFWAVLARARGDQGSRDLVPVLASNLSRKDAAKQEKAAGTWLQDNMTNWKPSAGH